MIAENDGVRWPHNGKGEIIRKDRNSFLDM
jgi:hypothetical protein